MKERIAIAQKDLINALSSDEKLIANYEKMADTKLRDKAIERVIRRIFNVDPSTKQDDISTRKRNQIESFANSLDTSIKEQGSTIWALFNGVTRYTNHVLNADNDNKLDSLMAGRGYDISNIGYKEIMKYIEENSSKTFKVF